MPSLYNFIDRVADVVISVISPSKHSNLSSTHARLNRKRQKYDYDDYHYYQYPDQDEKYNSRSSSDCHSSRQPNDVSFAVPDPQSESASPTYDDDHRSWKRSWHNKSVHWGRTTEFADNTREPKAPGLSEYPSRRNDLRNKDRNYVYGREEFFQQTVEKALKSQARYHGPGAFPSSEHSTSFSFDPRSNLERGEEKVSYEDQRYPEDWYSSSSRPSRSPSPSVRKSQPLHKTHRPRKSILRRPTATDDEMLIRNLWAMVVLADERLDYTYEFLSGSLLVGDDVVDTMMMTGELAMSEEATERAKRVQNNRREKAMRDDHFPMRMPVPPSQRQRERESKRSDEHITDESYPEEIGRPSSRMDHFDENPSPNMLDDILENEE
ncbi:hypothetical protein BDV18DRAFT_164980 [Aspergillus unguis]